VAFETGEASITARSEFAIILFTHIKIKVSTKQT